MCQGAPCLLCYASRDGCAGEDGCAKPRGLQAPLRSCGSLSASPAPVTLLLPLCLSQSKTPQLSRGTPGTSLSQRGPELQSHSGMASLAPSASMLVLNTCPPGEDISLNPTSPSSPPGCGSGLRCRCRSRRDMRTPGTARGARELCHGAVHCSIAG